MRAARIRAYGEPPEVAEMDEPRPGEDEAVVDVEVAGINPIDLWISSGTFYSGNTPLPYVPGVEVIGRKAGGGLLWFDDAVPPHGSMAELAVVPDSSGIPVPGGIDPTEAIAFGVAGLAAWLSLGWRGQLKQGETVLVLGASGSVGQVAIQAARILGAGLVVGAARSAAGRDKVSALGADEVLDTGTDLAESISEATGGGPDLVVDCLWGEPAVAAITAMKPLGRLVQVGNSAGGEAAVPAGPLRGGQLDIRGHRNFRAPLEVRADAFHRMCDHSMKGDLKVEVEVVPLEQAADAWRRQSKSPGHKLAIRP